MLRALTFLLLLPGCAGVALSTRVADTESARLAMAMSVDPGLTTETMFTTRWGYPMQKVREGAQTEFVYRKWRDSDHYVIVTFQSGLATGVRTSDGIACRATFVPRPPGYGWNDPTVVGLHGRCPLAPFLDGTDRGPIANPVSDDGAWSGKL